MERLADRFRVIAVDLYGSGKTAAWPQDQPMHLDDELHSLRLRVSGGRRLRSLAGRCLLQRCVP